MIRRTSLLWKVAAAWLCATLAAEASTRGQYPGPKGALTITVAASDTAQPPQQRADFVCDGADDQVEIQAAIDLLPVAGGTVRLLAGNYSVTENAANQYCILINRDDVALIFDRGAVIRLADGVFPATEVGHVITVGSGLTVIPPPLRRNISIWGPGIIDGNRANNAGVGGGATSSNAAINCHGQLDNIAIGGGLTIKNAIGVGINQLGVSVGGDPASPYLQTRIRWHDLTMTGCAEGTLPYLVDGMIIDNLLLEDTITQDGWEPIGVHNLVMTNSIIRDTTGSAMDIFQGSAPSVNYSNLNHVYSNCIFGPNKAGGDVIAIGVGASGSTAAQNILLENCVIDMGDGTLTGTTGIQIGDRAGPMTTTSHTRGITLNGCIVDGTASAAGSDGIVIGDYAEEIVLNNCIVFNCGRHGLRIVGGLATVPDQPTRILVSGGEYYNNGRDTAGGSGISVEQSDFVTIEGVECYDSQGTPTQDYGIDLSGGPADVIVLGCTFWGNVIDAIRAGEGCWVSDGTVNVQALIDLLICFGQPAVPGCESADINADGSVNTLDLIDLLLENAVCP